MFSLEKVGCKRYKIYDKVYLTNLRRRKLNTQGNGTENIKEFLRMGKDISNFIDEETVVN